MNQRGDTARQAALRDAVIGKSKKDDAYIRKIQSVLSPGDNLLDIGCGTGHVFRWMSGLGWRVLGVDLSA